MSKWKMVPAVQTREMQDAMQDAAEAQTDVYEAALAAAPAWEPSDEDVERAIAAFYAHGVLEMRTATRAAILAAVGGKE